MQPFKWNKKHEVFVPELDAEHRSLFRVAEELRTAVQVGSGQEHVGKLIAALGACVEDHLRHEERLMRASSYPAFEWHKQQHETLRKRVKAYSREVEAGDLGAVVPLVEFLAIWLKEHTGLADRMMSAYLRNYQRSHTRLVS